MLSGPVGIVDVISDTYTASESYGFLVTLMNLLSIMMLLSSNLGVINLLPLPALDGGRLFFLLLNGILWLLIRHRIPAKYESYVHYIGLLLLLGLMVVVALQDVFRIIS